jgi:hypothetical protein
MSSAVPSDGIGRGDVDWTVCADVVTAIVANATNCRLRARLMPIMMTRRCCRRRCKCAQQHSSWLPSHNRAANRGTLRLWNWLAGKHGANGFFQVMMRRLRPLGAQGYVPVINPPAV